MQLFSPSPLLSGNSERRDGARVADDRAAIHKRSAALERPDASRSQSKPNGKGKNGIHLSPMDEPEFQVDNSHAIFTSVPGLATDFWSRLENDKGAAQTEELVAAIYLLAANLDHYMKECVMVREQLKNLIHGGDLAQTMMKNLEKH